MVGLGEKQTQIKTLKPIVEGTHPIPFDLHLGFTDNHD